MPSVLFPAAEPQAEADVAAVAEPLVSEEYVYLFRVVRYEKALEYPSANIPMVLLPAAEPPYDPAVDAVAAPTTQPT
jgi:hypothetical protein